MDKPIVFISYSHKDEIWKDCLLPQLKTLQQLDRIIVWDDRKIDAGDKWYPEIKEAMEKARVAICLISSNYLASDFCVKEEVPFLLQRCEKEGLHMCDCHLEWARLRLAKGECDKAREHWATARAMVKRMGYHRRDHEVEMIARELGEAV